MSRRAPNTRKRISFAAFCVGGLFAGVGPLAGCIVGAGDDRALPLIPHEGGDARSDGAMRDGLSDGLADARPADVTAEAFRDGATEAGDATIQDASDAGMAASPPSVVFSATGIDFGLVGCGSIPPTTKTLTIDNKGGSPLVVSASVVGVAFGISPTSLMVRPGMSGMFTLTATVPGSSTAGSPLIGSLALFTNDPFSANRVLPVSVTPSGATLMGAAVYTFASSEVNTPAPLLNIQLTNIGNAPATFSIGAPSDPAITIASTASDGGLTLLAGSSWYGAAAFTPTNPKTITAKAAITATGVVCGMSLPSIQLSGQGATGTIAGWPSNNTIDFGSAPCGGMAPAPRTVTLVNSSPTTAALVTKVDTSGMKLFTTDAKNLVRIPAAGGTLTINFTAPPVPKSSPLTPITETLLFQTDADPAPVQITLTESPQGAILDFDALAKDFGSFGTVILLQSATQTFSVKNSGNVAANVTVLATENGGADADAGADASPDSGGDAAPDATMPPGGTPTFAVSSPAFALAAAPSATTPSTQQDSVTFQPIHANQSVGSLALAVDSATPLCAPLPAPLKLAGTAIGGGPVVTQTALSFQATCGGPAPGSQTFVVLNAGTLNLNWTMGAVRGPGAALYTVSASPPPGLLIPGASSTVTVTAAAVPSPAPNPNPAALVAQVAIDTDVPFDPSHIITLRVVPLGDQLSVSTGSLRFGQIPVNTSVSQNFTVSNNANPGSPDATLALSVINGWVGGGTAFSVQAGSNIPAGGNAIEGVTFNATTPGSYPATIAFKTTDALCSALPSPVVLSGTGTNGQLALSSTTLAFGTDPVDVKGLVACGKTGPAQTLSLSNVGNQSFKVTGATLARGATSPFALSGPGMTVPIQLLINAATTITITPWAIPQAVADPNDPGAYSDVLTITTDAVNDTPHAVALVMQPYGAIIANTPAQTAWNFGSNNTAGSISTYSSTISNLGNAPATVTLKGLGQPTVFGMKINPTTVPAKDVAVLVGQFSPPSASGTWVDQGQLVVDAPAFCQPLPSQWNLPSVNLTGSTSPSASLTVSGNLVFPTTDCGMASPTLPGVVLGNATNQAYAYTAKFGSGTWYTLGGGGSGMLPANGSTTIVVSPKTVTPGPGVLPGSAPYADNLIISVATSPPTAFNVPIAWTLNGAVLSLVDGTGPNGQGFYVADSTSGFALRIDNAGTASPNVDFVIAPLGAFSLQPAPVQVNPNIRALPQFVSGSSAPACHTTTNGSATFQVKGPVCQPFSIPAISVHACMGTY